jgi:two-component SAPR family response regulator
MLENKSVLIVEDEFLIGQLLHDMLGELDCRSITYSSDLSRALHALSKSRPDLAIIDLNLDGQSAVPLAVKLRDEQIPFIISSGYAPKSLDPEWQLYPILTKPFLLEALQNKISQALALNKL